ncbi:hypothetical protein [Acinetobacter sp. ANC 4779]|uniref:hypothetical protein n=1 Tax=Acinetobacter sp. ANC 4779 TaxID=2529848 RepID=UPI001D18745D|nr:hypothetical protein [Acinetobacter sp. ANC 4779]
MPKQDFAQQFAQALMLEQTRFIKKQLLAEQNNLYIEQFVHHLYTHSDQVSLKQCIQLESLQDVVQKYAFELNLGAEILEFIGMVAQRIHHVSSNSQTQINQLLSDESFELWLYKILELDQLRHYIHSNLLHDPQVKHVSLQLANQILESNTPWLDHLRRLNTHQHGLGSKILNFIQDQQQNIELKLEQQLAQALVKQLGNIILLPNEELADISLHLWDDIKQRTLKETFSQFQAIDFEEFFILVYETWRQLRQGEHLQQMILDVVTVFYNYFADYNLQELLQSVGLDEDDLHQEALRFLPHTIQTLEQQGLLHGILEQLISPFFLSETTQQFIEQYIQDKL